MQLVLFSAKPYDHAYFKQANAANAFNLAFYTEPLTAKTYRLAEGAEAVCVFVNDRLDANVINRLADNGVKVIALRCAGFNNVDLDQATERGIAVLNVPTYSPQAVAEHAVTLMLCLNRKIHKAFNRVRESNFSLNGLVGFDMAGKTVGLIGTGEIGLATARILSGFGCRVLAYDVRPNPACEQLGVSYVSLDELAATADIISLHCPLTPKTHHLVNAELLGKMKQGVMIINTSRGGIVDTAAVVEALKSGHVGHLGLDVYEGEAGLFFEDLSGQVIEDDLFSRLLTFPNVIITGHQAFLTHEALTNIATTTLQNVTQWVQQNQCVNLVNKAVLQPVG